MDSIFNMVRAFSKPRGNSAGNNPAAKVGHPARWATFFAAFLMLFIIGKATAGTWYANLSATASVSPSLEGGTFTSFQPANTGPNVGWGSAPDAVIAEPNATSSADGAVNITLYYVPSSSDPAGYAPDTVTDDISAYSTITASFDSQLSNTDFQSKSQCNNGFNDPCIFGSGNGTTLVTGDHVETLTSQGNHIQPYSVNKSFGTINSMPYTGMVQIPTINTTLTGDVDRPAGLNYLYQTACGTVISVTADSRTVQINAPVTYFKNYEFYGEAGEPVLDSDQDPVWSRAQNEPDGSGTLWGDIGIADGYPQRVYVKGGEGSQGTITQNTQAVVYGAELGGTNWNTSGMSYTWFDNLTSTTAWDTYGLGYNL